MIDIPPKFYEQLRAESARHRSKQLASSVMRSPLVVAWFFGLASRPFGEFQFYSFKGGRVISSSEASKMGVCCPYSKWAEDGLRYLRRQELSSKATKRGARRSTRYCQRSGIRRHRQRFKLSGHAVRCSQYKRHRLKLRLYSSRLLKFFRFLTIGAYSKKGVWIQPFAMHLTMLGAYIWIKTLSIGELNWNVRRAVIPSRDLGIATITNDATTKALSHPAEVALTHCLLTVGPMSSLGRWHCIVVDSLVIVGGLLIVACPLFIGYRLVRRFLLEKERGLSGSPVAGPLLEGILYLTLGLIVARLLGADIGIWTALEVLFRAASLWLIANMPLLSGNLPNSGLHRSYLVSCIVHWWPTAEVKAQLNTEITHEEEGYDTNLKPSVRTDLWLAARMALYAWGERATDETQD